MTSPNGHKAGPWAKVMLALIIIVSIVIAWAAVRSFETAAPAESGQLIPPTDDVGSHNPHTG